MVGQRLAHLFSLKYILLFVARWYVLIYLVIAFFRIPYPFEMEWMESGFLDHVQRILQGKGIYAIPSTEFVSYIYPPLYFYLSALLMKITGIVGLAPLRFLSFLSSLGCFYFIFLIVKRETQDRFSAFLACCLYAACFQAGGAWFDLARVDSLFLFLLLAGIYFFKFADNLKSYVTAGILIWLSFLTKQTALMMFLPALIYGFLVHRKNSLIFLFLLACLVGGSFLLINLVSDGWFYFYCFKLPRLHPLYPGMLGFFWKNDLWGTLNIACAISIFYLISELLNGDKRNFIFYFGAAVGMILGSWLSRLHTWGANNVLFPAYAIICILFGLSLAKIFKWVETNSSPGDRKVFTNYLYAICLTQFLLLYYNPFRFIPTLKDLEAGQSLVRVIANMEGEVFIANHGGYLNFLAGKKGYAHTMAIWDVTRVPNDEGQALLNEDLKLAIEQKRFNHIILDQDHLGGVPFRPEGLDVHYQLVGKFFENDTTTFWPVTSNVASMRIRPVLIYIPKR